jgi:putative transposase
MSRLARIVVPGFPHHVTQRGNRRARVFDDDNDRRRYLALLDLYRQKHGLEVWAYCLMSNHVHWIVVPRDEYALARAFRGAHTAFSLAMNRKRGETGHLWQNRFFSCPLDGAHAWASVRYVERNPLRARIVRRAENYAWSSAAGHCGLRADAMLSGEFPPAAVVPDWSAWLHAEDAAQTDFIRRQTRTGRPCGADGFVSQLEALLKRPLQLLKRGRKKKQKAEERGGLFE